MSPSRTSRAQRILSERADNEYGYLSGLAATLKVSRQAVHSWVHKGVHPDLKRAVELDKHHGIPCAAWFEFD